MNYVKFILVSFLLSVCSSHLLAEETRYYDVEVIIFQNLQPGSNSKEDWPSSMDYSYPENSLFIGEPFPGLIPAELNPRYTFKPVIRANYQLTEEAKLLEKSDKYRVLYHRAWRQPGLDEEKAIDVKIRNELAFINTEDQFQQTRTTSTVPVNQPQLSGNRTSELFGTIKVILKRYLHVKTDLYYKSYKYETLETIDSDFQTVLEPQLRPVIIDLKESRKMRSKEIHYLDNPVIGMLVYITPFEPQVSKN